MLQIDLKNSMKILRKVLRILVEIAVKLIEENAFKCSNWRLLRLQAKRTHVNRNAKILPDHIAQSLPVFNQFLKISQNFADTKKLKSSMKKFLKIFVVCRNYFFLFSFIFCIVLLFFFTRCCFETFFNFEWLFPRMQPWKSSILNADHWRVEHNRFSWSKNPPFLKFTTETPKGSSVGSRFAAIFKLHQENVQISP